MEVMKCVSLDGSESSKTEVLDLKTLGGKLGAEINNQIRCSN